MLENGVIFHATSAEGEWNAFSHPHRLVDLIIDVLAVVRRHFASYICAKDFGV